MAAAAVSAHIEAERRLRALIVRAIERLWTDLGSYDRADVPRFLDQAVPVVLAGQRQSVALTAAMIARRLGERPPAVPITDLIGPGVRAGASTREVYTRPFIQTWTALGKGGQWADAVHAGLARASETAAMDMQLSMRATASAISARTPTIERWQRVADAGACEFCQAVDGAVLLDAGVMGLHNNCGCSIEPLTEAPPITPTPDSVAVHEHGELGAMLTDPSHEFAGPPAVH